MMAEFRCDKCQESIFSDNTNFTRWLAGNDKVHSNSCDGILKRWRD